MSSRLAAVVRRHPSTVSPRDFAANAIATIPVGFGLCGWLDRRRRSPANAVIAITVPAVVGLTFEIGQLWIDTRVCSMYDLLAQFLGGSVGLAIWRIGARWAHCRACPRTQPDPGAAA